MYSKYTVAGSFMADDPGNNIKGYISYMTSKIEGHTESFFLYSTRGLNDLALRLHFMKCAFDALLLQVVLTEEGLSDWHSMYSPVIGSSSCTRGLGAMTGTSRHGCGWIH
jgi:hypothetical protein